MIAVEGGIEGLTRLGRFALGGEVTGPGEVDGVLCKQRILVIAVNSTEKGEVQPDIDRSEIVGWLFLVGSLMFTVDGVMENLQGISLSSLLHLSASILFSVGSLLLLPRLTRG